MSLILVAQTTWAVVREGQGKHIEDESRAQFTKVAHVRALWLRKKTYLVRSNVSKVTHG